MERFAICQGNVTFMTRHEISCKRNLQSTSLAENIRISTYLTVSAFESRIAVSEHNGQQWHPQRQVMILRMCLHNSTHPHPECIESPTTWRTVFREQSPEKPSNIRSHRRQYPCHRCCRLGLRRTQHCHPHLRDRICERTVSISHPIFAASRCQNLRNDISSSMHKNQTVGPSHRNKIKRARKTYVSVSLIFALSGNSPYAFKLLASSALYFNMTSPFSSW